MNFTSCLDFTGEAVQWTSPELLDPVKLGYDYGPPTKGSDCYSLGMVIYEVLTGSAPFMSLEGHALIQDIVNGKRPGRPEGTKGTWFTDDLWKMLGLCWATDPQSRPSVEAVLECLERVSSTWKPFPLQESAGGWRDKGELDE